MPHLLILVCNYTMESNTVEKCSLNNDLMDNSADKQLK